MRAFVPDDLFAIAWLGACDISSDGARVAVVVTRLDRDEDQYRSAIWVVDVATGECRRFTAGPGRDLAPRWSPDSRWLAFLREKPGEKPQLAVMPIAGGEARVITAMPFGAGQPEWAPDSRRIAFAARTGTPPDPDPKKARPYRRITHLRSRMNGEGWTYDRRRHLFVIDALDEGSQARQITDGDWDDLLPAWSPDGSSIAFASARHETRDRDVWMDVWTMPAEGGEPTRLTSANRMCTAPAWSPDGATIAFHERQHPAGANARLHVVPSRGGPVRIVDAAFDHHCPAGSGGTPMPDPPKWLPDGRLLYLAEDRGEAALVIAEEGRPTLWLAKQPRTLTSCAVARDGAVAAFVASQPTSPAELFLVDVSSGEERQLTSFNDRWRGQVSLSAPEKFTIETDPGIEVDVWIMKPLTFEEGGQHPVLLNIHGGPFTQYGETFFDEFQVYAGAGYGVVFCNPRGSSGRSSEFGRAVVGRLGEPDSHDVMAALDAALTRMPWADASRLGVMGGSYGGFMTTWIVGHDHRFAAAISERAVNDQYAMQGTSDIGWFFNPAYLGEHAVVEDDVQALLRQSPLTYARHIRTPVLILHAEDDLRCPISQAEQLFVVMKRLERDVEFVRFPDENHEMSRSGRPSHRIDRFAVILEYLGRKLGKGAAEVAAVAAASEQPLPPD